ncbi:CDK5 regulatory subunit-associated protein 3-like [Amphiura filiformis]|uniref:CDK5 regulatory subunit-associated protein 3-like n=1 Tax=Amphiura filiformis TaxID=82378 RepID=UPI003B21C32C
MQTGELSQEQIVNLPIDISSNKLLDWLIDRRHVNLKWQAAALIVREKINAAIQDMPEVEEIKQLLAGQYINYFHCCRIIELLKVSEADSKNIFGYYSSQRMKDWKEVLWLYEKDSVYLAEAAQMLIRNVSYEIPSVKKHIAKCQQMKSECEKKEKDYVNNAASARDDYHTSCKKLGIKGEKVKAELLDMVRELPTNVFEPVVHKVTGLKDILIYYHEFVKFVSGNPDSDGVSTPLLRFVQEHGNATVYQWRTGKEPQTVEEVHLSFLEEEEEVEEGEIDWGDIDAVTDEGIDFGINVEEGGSSINFDIEVADESGGGGIDWGDGGAASMETGTEQLTSKDDGIARGNDSFAVLDHQPTRSVFINELLELEGFLTQRLNEMKDEADILSVNQFQSAPAMLQMKTSKEVAAMLDLVKDILAIIMDSRTQHLFLIKNSPKYVDRLTETLKEKLTLAEKMVASQQAVREKGENSLEDARALQPKLNTLIDKTRELQRHIEEDISKRYKNRPVNLMGAINTI